MIAPQRIGCQTYSWEMLGPDWTGTPTQILDAVSAAGYDGIEFSNVMIGDYVDDPDRLARDLEVRNMSLAAYAYSSKGFADPARFETHLETARQALRFCAELKAPLCMGGAASPSRENYDQDVDQAIKLYRIVAEEGGPLGVTVCVHPHSHHGSLFESAEEYDRLLTRTAASGLMFNPDAGHIIRGGQNLIDCLRAHRSRIAHVHIKDVDSQGNWQPLGQGIIDWNEFFAFLDASDYREWVVAEEESALVPEDPAAAVAANRRFLRSLGR